MQKYRLLWRKTDGWELIIIVNIACRGSIYARGLSRDML